MKGIKMHAERCPVCGGIGTIESHDNYAISTTVPIIISCHACNGRGYILVSDKGD